MGKIRSVEQATKRNARIKELQNLGLGYCGAIKKVNIEESRGRLQ